MIRKLRFCFRNAILAAGVLLCGTVPTSSYAGKCGGTNINNLLSWDQTEIAKGTTLATLRLTTVIYSDDPKAPYHLASGECIGTFLTGPDGHTRASGSCARKDKDGDVLYEEWTATDGMGNKGTEKNVGGTGKYAKATSNAQWEFTQLQGKMGAVRWAGDCQF
jgi:hypothetical protein